MHGGAFFFQAFIYLAAAVVVVPIAKRLGLGSVLGYLIAGIVVGPFGLSFIGEERTDVMHFAEFGVVMMLFLIGLELEPKRVWRMRNAILGLGGLQVTVTSVAIAGAAMIAGLALPAALAVGMTLSLSSTAIVMQTLSEKGLRKTTGGRSAFSVLLFQDLAVIPMLALLPLLAVGDVTPPKPEGGSSWLTDLPAGLEALVVLGAVTGVVLGGRFLVRPAFRYIARTRQREIFTAAALLLVIGIALLMDQVGLSPALGTFLAGVVLATSEYRHELEVEIEPLKGLLLGVFFLAVGASIDFALVASRPELILGLVVALIFVKALVLFGLGRAFRLGLDQNFLFTLALAEAGEFAFVLFSFAQQNRVLPESVTAPLVAAVALSMALTPLLLLLNERVLAPRLGTKESEGRDADQFDEENPVIIAGFGDFGSIVGRLLSANGVSATVLDSNSDRVDMLRRLGFKVFYGDASRHDLLESAGAANAKLLVVAIDDPERAAELVRTVRKHFPQLKVLVRAGGRAAAYRLTEDGAEHVYRDTLDSSLRMGIDALRHLGIRAYHAHRSARTFRRHDEELVRELASLHGDSKSYIDTARQRIQNLEDLLRSEVESEEDDAGAGWDVESLTREFGRPE
jgi:CPA2 family monovalent cation:H+ antiporter-2/glutathione-regulated potassium-efflux system protein KefB